MSSFFSALHAQKWTSLPREWTLAVLAVVAVMQEVRVVGAPAGIVYMDHWKWYVASITCNLLAVVAHDAVERASRRHVRVPEHFWTTPYDSRTVATISLDRATLSEARKALYACVMIGKNVL